MQTPTTMHDQSTSDDHKGTTPGGTPMQGTPGPTGEVWGRDELQNPHQREDKPGRVRGMFAAIAGSYDLNNRLHSFGLDQAWRRKAVQMAEVRTGDEVLDVACGTGDLTHLFAASPAGRVVGGDFTPQMLEIAREKQKRIARPEKVSYQEVDAMALPFGDASFDVVSIAFGIRNVATPERALSEFARVLRPGGRLVVLEFDRPRNAVIRFGNELYTQQIMPRTATLISGDRSGAYRYLPRSVDTFMTREAMCEAIGRAGFSDVRARALTFGVCVCYRGVRR